MGSQYGPHMGFANGIGMGPIWYSIWDLYGPHIDIYMGFGNGNGMGPIWVLNMGHTWAIVASVPCWQSIISY